MSDERPREFWIGWPDAEHGEVLTEKHHDFDSKDPRGAIKVIEYSHHEKALAEKDRVIAELRNSLQGFLEYFDAIQRGEYQKNGRDKKIRTFEEVLILRARQALAASESEN